MSNENRQFVIKMFVTKGNDVKHTWFWEKRLHICRIYCVY